VRLSYPTSEVDKRVRETWLTLGGVALVSLAAAVVIGAVLARSVARPLRRLQRAATRLGGGDLTARAPDDGGPREVRSLASAFNDTADRLAALVNAQDEFVADASHQLRSPLTALQLRLENLEPAVAEPDRSDVAAALGEVARMSRLVDGLLALARADRQGAPVAASPLAVLDALEERASVWAPVADERAVDIVVSGPADLEVLATPDRLRQVLDNLLANAIDVSPIDSTLRLTAEVDGNRGVLHITDEGPGMAPDQRHHAFDRFWRGETARRGSGLGLAIVQKLVRADGGEVSLHPVETGGLDVRVRLRRAPS
jgi:signal transduction histidine kinase